MAEPEFAQPLSDPTLPASKPPPGVSPRKWARLEAFLGALPPAASVRLFETLEHASSADGAMPTAAMLKALRRRLISTETKFPPRKLSAQRLFFTPFEDFYVARRRGRKRRARIDRNVLTPLWSLILGDPALADAARAASALDAAIAGGERDLWTLRDALCLAASDGFARLIAHADDNPGFRADLGARLSGGAGQGDAQSAAAVLDLAEFALILPAASYFEAARALFPRPLDALSVGDLAEAERLYARIAAAAPEAAGHLLLLIAARLSAPWRSLSLFYHLTARPAVASSHGDAALLIDAVFDDLEGLARALERDAEDDPDTEDAPARLAHFAEFADGVAAQAARAQDGVIASRVDACRDIAASALARWCEQALAAIRRMHPVRHAGGSSRLMALRPDILRPVDRRDERAACAAAGFLSRAGALAERLQRPDAAGGFLADAIAETERYAGDLVAEIRAAEGDERAAARRRMDATLAVGAGLLSENEIALLKERAAVAAVSA